MPENDNVRIAYFADIMIMFFIHFVHHQVLAIISQGQLDSSFTILLYSAKDVSASCIGKNVMIHKHMHMHTHTHTHARSGRSQHFSD